MLGHIEKEELNASNSVDCNFGGDWVAVVFS